MSDERSRKLHDLRGAIGVMVSTLDAIERRVELSPRLRELVESARRSGAHSLEILEELRAELKAHEDLDP